MTLWGPQYVTGEGKNTVRTYLHMEIIAKYSKNQKVFFLQEFMSNLLSNLAENIDHTVLKSRDNTEKTDNLKRHSYKLLGQFQPNLPNIL